MTAPINLDTVPPQHRAAFASLTAAAVAAVLPSKALVLGAREGVARTIVPRASFAALSPFALGLSQKQADRVASHIAADPGASSRWVVSVVGADDVFAVAVSLLSGSIGRA